MTGAVSLLTFIAIFGCCAALYGTDNFFFYHDSRTTYRRGNEKFTADVTCWSKNAPNCNITIKNQHWTKTREYGGIKDSKIRFKDGCPPVVCAKRCQKFVVNPRDNCPVCLCDGFLTREPCKTIADCPYGSTGCRRTEHVCEYRITKEEAKTWPRMCKFLSDCPPFHACQSKSKCVKNSSQDYHIPEKRCSFDSDCQLTGFKCDFGQRTCYAKNGYCLKDEHCRDGYECVQKKCQKMPRNRIDKKKPKQLTCTDCWFWQPCKPDFTCGSLWDAVVQWFDDWLRSS